MLDKLKSLLSSRRQTAGAGSPSTKKREINITIGLDFGTASTKCVVNLERYANGQDKFLAMTFPSKAYPQGIFCVPTSIGVQRNRLVFGEEAEKLPEDKVIRSVKMAIPCVNTTWGDYRSPFKVAKRPGYFKIGKYDFSAVDLAMLYLSNIMRRIKVQLKKYVRGDVNIKRFLNLAAPLDQLIDIFGKIPNVHNIPASENATRDSSISRHYMELGQRCLLMGDLSHDPWELEDAVATVEKIKGRALRPFEESPTYVQTS